MLDHVARAVLREFISFCRCRVESKRRRIGAMKPNTLFLVILALLSYFAPTFGLKAVSPAPDGGYAGNNTAEGTSALFSLTSGTDNTALGFQALYHNTTAPNNVAVGTQALFNTAMGTANTATGTQALYHNISGSSNTATGYQALFTNTGSFNTATGTAALHNNNSGIENTANGGSALYSNTIGNYNTANGYAALFNNRSGSFNTAEGVEALQNNTSGHENTASGYEALLSNTNGSGNTATGVQALEINTSGSANTAVGYNALSSNRTANNNTAIGSAALVDNTIGANNTAAGGGALATNQTGSNNTADGAEALLRTTGSNNVGLGYNAGNNLTAGSNNIDISNVGVAAESNAIRVGTSGVQTKAFIAGISGIAVTGTAVVVNGSGQVGVAPSSQRFKDSIKPMDNASEAILALEPVTFRYKQEFDPACIPQFGLVAEEVEKVDPDLVARDADGKPYTVRYEAVNAMLLNEFLKEHKAFVQEQRKVQEQGATIARLEKQIEALAAGFQKVSAQLELNKSDPQTILNND